MEYADKMANELIDQLELLGIGIDKALFKEFIALDK